MFDFFRELGQSAEEKRSELLNAYLDDNLSAKERDQLEAQLQQDTALRADLAQMQMVQQQLRAMPRRRVPRSFTLDPALYSPPKPQRSQQLYPVLRGATALTALLFVFVLGLSLFNTNFAGEEASPSEAITMAAQQEEALLVAPEAESPAAELAQIVPEGAESTVVAESAAEESAALADEPPASGMGGETAAESPAPEEPSLELASPAESVEENERAAADDSALKETVTAESVMATEAAVAVESYDTAEEVAAAEDSLDEATPSDASPSPQPAIPYQTVAIALGIATLALGILTLLFRGRARL